MDRMVRPLVACFAVFSVAILLSVAIQVVAALVSGPARASEVPPDFGRFRYLSDLAPGTWFWSETDQKAYLVLTDGRYADPATGDVYGIDPDRSCGWVCQVRLSVTRPNGLDMRPWVPPDRKSQPE